MTNMFQDIKNALLKELSDRLISIPYVITVRDSDTLECRTITHVEACFMESVLHDILDADNEMRNGIRCPDGIIPKHRVDNLLVQWIDDYNVEDEEHAVAIMFGDVDPMVVSIEL